MYVSKTQIRTSELLLALSRFRHSFQILELSFARRFT
jgi:hypothetical protein